MPPFPTRAYQGLEVSALHSSIRVAVWTLNATRTVRVSIGEVM